MVGQALPSGRLARPAPTGPAPHSVRAGSIIGSHTIEHIYARGFLVLLTEIHEALGLPPFQTFLLDGVRSLAAGTMAMSTGFLVDMFQHRMGHVLWMAMAMMGIGYLLVGLSTSYLIIMISIMVASGGSALWHPPAMALLSLMYPTRRGLFMALHRSTGNIGEAVAPIIVWALLIVLNWQGVVMTGVPVIAIIAVLIFVFMRNVGGPLPDRRLRSFRYNLRRKGVPLAGVVRSGGMISLITVNAVRGVGDRALLLGIPLYLKDEIGMGTGGIAFHVALFTALAIVAGPILGWLSDRFGRKPMIVFVMAASVIPPLWMVAVGEGIGFTGAVALFGAFLFSVNSLTQAAAMDLAAEHGLEGSAVGLLWGVGTFVGFGASLISGVLAGWNWDAVFYFGAGSFAVGTVVALVANRTRVLGHEAPPCTRSPRELAGGLGFFFGLYWHRDQVRQPLQDDIAGLVHLAFVEVVGPLDDSGFPLRAVDRSLSQMRGYVAQVGATLATSAQGQQRHMQVLGQGHDVELLLGAHLADEVGGAEDVVYGELHIHQCAGAAVLDERIGLLVVFQELLAGFGLRKEAVGEPGGR